MKKLSKILFTDLDDTLLNTRKQITAENRRAIQQALQRGHQIVICTGRPLMGTTALIKELELDQPGSYAVTYNGGVIYDCFKKQIIYQKTIPIPYVNTYFRNHSNITCSVKHILIHIFLPPAHPQTWMSTWPRAVCPIKSCPLS